MRRTVDHPPGLPTRPPTTLARPTTDPTALARAGGGTPREHARGFTLFELVIVLVVVALIIAAVLQAASMRKEAYLKDLVATVKDLSEATRAFQERYRYLPGDLVEAQNDLPMSAAQRSACGMDRRATKPGNGLIDGTMDLEWGYLERDCAPLHLALAGLIREDAAPITRRFGELNVSIHFVARKDAKVSGLSTYPRVVQNVLELEGVPYSLAVRLDEILDDGVLTSGKVQACNANGTSVTPPQDRTPPEDPDATAVPHLAVPLL